MSRKTATLGDLSAWRPCWRSEGAYTSRVAKLAGRRKRWGWAHLVGLLGAEGLRDEDWLWVATAFLEHVGRDDVNRLGAASFANSALLAERRAGREPHADSFAAVRLLPRADG